MKKTMKSKISDFFALLAFLTSAMACSGHVHSYQFDYDETYHQGKCQYCSQTLEKEKHNISGLTDACTVCPYVDPVTIVNDKGVMTGLTEYGKTKLVVNVPEDVKLVGSKSFYGSNAITVYLPSSVEGVYENAFEGKANINIVTEEELVEWTYKDGVYYKNDLMANNEAYYNGKFYKTLDLAIAAIEDQDVKITLLHENITCEKTIQISFDITLEAYTASTSLKADFKILSSGSLTIAENVDYTGKVELPLTLYNDFGTTCYTSGSLLFKGYEVAPDGVEVNYTIKGASHPAIGAKQIANWMLVVPQTYYAYGSFKYSEDLQTIWGLTRFGGSVKNLTITAATKDKPAKIGDNAFVYHNVFKVVVLGISVEIVMNSFKGSFNEITIGEGVTEIGSSAFNNHIDNDLNAEMKATLGPLLSPLKKVTIGDSCKTIGNNAFQECISLQVVKTGKALEYIGEWAFHFDLNLTNVIMTESLNLKTIKGNAFVSDHNLGSVVLPSKAGWKAGNVALLESELDEATTARYLTTNTFELADWTRTLDGKYASYHPSSKDAQGRYTDVTFFSTLQDAIDKSSGDFVIRTTSLSDEKEIINLTVNKNVVIESYSPDGKISLGNVNIDNGATLIIKTIIKNYYGFYINCKDEGEGNISSNGSLIIQKEGNYSGYKIGVYFKDYLAAPTNTEIEKDGVKTACYGFGLLSFVYHKDSDKKVEMKKVLPTNCSINEIYMANPFANNGSAQCPEVSEIYFTAETFKDAKVPVISCDGLVKSIPADAFKNSASIISFALGKNVTHIGNFSFFGCVNLSNVGYTDSCYHLQEIGESAFENCIKLEETAFASCSLDLKRIGVHAFKGSGLKSFNMDNCVSVWHVSTKPIAELIHWTDLNDHAKAATLLRQTYCEVSWSRT